MMTGFGNVGSFTADEIIFMHDFYEAAVKAKEDCEIIHQAYHCFGIGEETVEVWRDRDSNNFEYLTRDGVWQARYLHQTYDVEITVESLFDLYKKAFMVTKGYVKHRYENTEFEKECIHAETVYRYFRHFVERSKNK